MDCLRLKSWKTYMSDGRSSATYGPADKNEVAVGIILGYEPLKITDRKNYLDIDSVILKLAAHIKRERKKAIK